MFTKVLVAVDGSAHAKHAIGYGAKIAAQNDAELVLLHVMRHTGSDRVPEGLKHFEQAEHIRMTEADLLRSVADSVLSDARDLAAAQGATNLRTVTEQGDPALKILDYCEGNEIDLVVLGRRGLGGFAGLLLGSVSQKLSQTVPCACLLCPIN